MKEQNFKRGDLVRVSADLTGDGTTPKGFIDKVETFLGATYYGVTFTDRPGGTTTTNPGLLTKL